MDPSHFKLLRKARPGAAYREGLFFFLFRRDCGWNRIGFGHPSAQIHLPAAIGTKRALFWRWGAATNRAALAARFFLGLSHAAPLVFVVGLMPRSAIPAHAL
jgi:hypothetical protein